MSSFIQGARVKNLDFGPGVVVNSLGSIVTVDFNGDHIDIDASELEMIGHFRPEPVREAGIDQLPSDHKRRTFRRAFEAMNLGVVPPEPDELIALSIGGDAWRNRFEKMLAGAPNHGLCKVVYGHYGDGKSHLLHLARSVALKNKWVVAYVEFDPKTVDPAKPFLVYRNLASSLVFPKREDGSTTVGFRGFIKEIREKWGSKALRYNSKYLAENPWFANGLDILLRYPHSEDEDYIAACGWLAGENQPIRIMNAMAAAKGANSRVPTMPRTLEASDIYVFHLVTIHHLCRELGYEGLLIIVDEAEHVRGYNVRRRERATNFFDLLARSANPPLDDFNQPMPNEHGMVVPKYWQAGPHFGLLVGLTPGALSPEESGNPEQNVFIHSDEDHITIERPTPEDYEKWSRNYMRLLYECYPLKSGIIAMEEDRRKLAQFLSDAYSENVASGLALRHWIKLAGLVGCMVLSGNAGDIASIEATIETVAAEYKFGALPWR